MLTRHPKARRYCTSCLGLGWTAIDDARGILSPQPCACTGAQVLDIEELEVLTTPQAKALRGRIREALITRWGTSPNLPTWHAVMSCWCAAGKPQTQLGLVRKVLARKLPTEGYGAEFVHVLHQVLRLATVPTR